MKKHQLKFLAIVGIAAMATSIPIIITSCTPTISINNQGKPEFGEYIEWSSSSTRWDVREWKYNFRNTPSQIQTNITLQNDLLNACVDNLLINSFLLNKYNIIASIAGINEINDQQGYLSIRISLDGWISQGQKINGVYEEIFHLSGFYTSS